MSDREKVIYNLEIISVCCKNRKNIKAYDEIDREMYADWEEIIENALELLKAQRETIDELISADKALKLLKEQETKPLRCKECSYHRNDGWCDEHRREVKESDYCSFGAWKGR